MGLSHSPRIVTDGLVLCLDAANVKSYPGSGTTWTDLSGRNNNGTLTNGPTFDADNGGSVVFDGVDDVVTIPTPYNNTVTGLTWSIWFKGIKTADYGYIIHNNSTGNSTGQSHITIGIDGANRYYGAFSGRYLTMFSNITQSNTIVRNLVLTWDGVNQNFYIDGILQVSEALADLSAYAIDTTTAICNYKLNYRDVTGNVYNITTYNRALSELEIQQNFNALRGRFGI